MTFKTSSKRTAEIDAASKNEEHLMSGITHPGLHDCLCGRGGHATNHPGNIQFRLLVNQYKDHYMGLSRYGKLQVAAEVVQLWRSQNPAGRFLATGGGDEWHDIGDKEAIKKTSQCLRERIPAHQKARTLGASKVTLQKARALVEKTKKTTDKLNLMSSQQQHEPLVASSSHDAQPQNHRRQQSQSQFSQWLQGQEQSIQQQDLVHNSQQRALLCQPTPIVENGTVSQVNNVDNNRYATVSPLDGGDKQFMISAPTTTTSTTEQDWPGTVSQSESELEEWMTDAVVPAKASSDDNTIMDPITLSSSLLRRRSTTQSTCSSDTCLIPSAANLTRDAFGEDSTSSSSADYNNMPNKRFSYHRSSCSGASDVSCMSGPFMIQDDNDNNDDVKDGEEALDRMMEDYQTKSLSNNSNNTTTAPTTLSLSSGFGSTSTGLNSDLFAW